MYRTLLCAFLCLVLYSSAKADTFTLNAGVAATGLDIFSINASGPNITIHGAAFFIAAPTFATCTPLPCGPGSTLDIGGAFDASLMNTANPFGGGATINGVTFTDVNFSGVLNFTGSIVLPDNWVDGEQAFIPFTMEGQLIGTIRCPGVDPAANCTQQVFDVFLNGPGVSRTTTPLSGTRTVLYEFSPVPEPATLGLLGIGLSGLFASVRRRRRNRR